MLTGEGHEVSDSAGGPDLAVCLANKSKSIKTVFQLGGQLDVKSTDVLRRVEAKVPGAGKKGGSTPSP